MRKRGADQEAVGIEKRRRWPPDDALVFPERHRGDVGAILALVDLGLDPDLLQILGDELRAVDQRRLAEAVEVDDVCGLLVRWRKRSME